MGLGLGEGRSTSIRTRRSRPAESPRRMNLDPTLNGRVRVFNAGLVNQDGAYTVLDGQCRRPKWNHALQRAVACPTGSNAP